MEKDYCLVLKMADKVEPIIQVTDHNGKTYKFRKYHWMGSIGLTDEHGKEVLLPAIRTRKRIRIMHVYEAIIVGNKLDGWEVYSLDLQKLWPETFSTTEEVYQKLRDRNT